MIAYVSVGGNSGDVVLRIVDAASLITERLGPVRSSRLYRTAPIGPVADQPAFVNAVFELELPDASDPEAVLAVLQDVERWLGRDRSIEQPQGPRPIDLDLLIAGDRIVASPSLTLPHPRLRERRFALLPLFDLVGASLAIPGTSETVGDRLADPAVAAQSVEPLDQY